MDRAAGLKQAFGWWLVVCGWSLLATVVCIMGEPYMNRDYFNVGLERMWQDLANHQGPTFRAECFGPASRCK